MLVRTMLGAVAGGAFGVIISGLLQGAHAGAAGGACALLSAAGAMVATRGVRPGALGSVAMTSVGLASMLCGMVCADSGRIVRASDSDLRMALSVQAASDLDAKGELRAADLALVQSATTPEQLPANIVLATQRAWERMNLTARASFRDSITAEKRLARGYLAGFGPLSVINSHDLAWGGVGLFGSLALAGITGRRAGTPARPTVQAPALQFKRAA